MNAGPSIRTLASARSTTETVATPRRIADTHIHLWDRYRNSYPWMDVKRDYENFAGDLSAIRKTYRLPDLIADTAGLPVEKFVHIQGHMATDDPSEETRWLQEIADAHGSPQGIVGFALLHDPGVEKILEDHSRYANHRGIRHSVNWHSDRFYSMCDRPDYMTDTAWQRGYGLLAKYGMSFDLQIFPHQLGDAAALAAKFPDVPLVIEHCAFPIERDEDGMSRWRAGLAELAALPNTVVKITGLVLLDHQWTEASLRPIIRQAVEIFGPDRAMFGSNFPVDKAYIRYDQSVACVSAALSDLGVEELDQVFYGTACRTYRL